ncbi:MAG: helix-turn-helix domain-containing protein [Bacillota bacterium]|nr:helix-turn-helix domain-containing protein [Bacillota bacterium]
MITFNQKQYNCPLEMTIDLIGGKWKVLILWNLAEGTLRFNKLKSLFPDITQKMLTQQLRDLENNGIVSRKVYPQIPPKVEYSLTEFGKSLMPVLYAMNKWGTDYICGNS